MIEKHKKLNFYILILSSFLLSCLYGQESEMRVHPLVIKEHVPWTLEAAKARIEAHRKADFYVVLELPNGDSIPVGANYHLKQVDHEFLFGGSLAADWSVPV